MTRDVMQGADRCDRCPHTWADHTRDVITSRTACAATWGTDHDGKPATCPCDGFFPKRKR